MARRRLEQVITVTPEGNEFLDELVQGPGDLPILDRTEALEAEPEDDERIPVLFDDDEEIPVIADDEVEPVDAAATAEALEPAGQAAALIPYQLSGDNRLSGRLGGLMGDVNAAARATVDERIRTEGLQLTTLQKDAMIQVEAFRQVGSVDLTAMCMRVHYLRTIQQRNLLAAHPAQYRNLNEMAADNGVSVTELLASLDLVNIIFPYIQNVLGIDVWDLWQQVGKSKLKEMIPVLKSIITGEQADTETTRNSVNTILENVGAGMEVADAFRPFFQVANDETAPAEQREAAQEHIRQETARMAVADLVDHATRLPTEELRRHLRPARTPNIHFLNVQDGENSYVLAQLEPEQVQMLQRVLRERVEFTTLELAEDPRTRQAEAFANPALRRIYERLYGATA